MMRRKAKLDKCISESLNSDLEKPFPHISRGEDNETIVQLDLDRVAQRTADGRRAATFLLLV